MNRQQQQPPWAVWVPLQQTLLVLACSAVGWLLLVRRQYQAEQLLEEAGPQQPQQGQDAGQWREQERRQQLRQVQRQRRVDPGLAAELALNRMLFQASHAQRTEIVAIAWDMWRHSNSWLARLLRWLRCPDRADQHNKEALCVMPPPDFETASPAELVKFYNRAGIYVAPGMLPADPEMALEGEFEALRRAAPAFLPVYQYFRSVQSLMCIEDEGLAAQALLGLSRLQLPTPAYGQEGAQRLRRVVASQAEQLRVALLDDRRYAEHLPQPDRDMAASGGLDRWITRAEHVVERMIKAKSRGAARDHDRWIDEVDQRPRRSCYRQPTNYELVA